jgi:2-dehydro-3-deoxygluconokinase
VEEAARRLGELAETVVVTLAAEGAIAFSGGEIVAAAAERVEHPVDTTGAGDLLVAAYIWAELRGAESADRLRWAVLYASLAVTASTGVGGAVKEADLIEAGAARGLAAPPLAGIAQV